MRRAWCFLSITPHPTIRSTGDDHARCGKPRSLQLMKRGRLMNQRVTTFFSTLSAPRFAVAGICAVAGILATTSTARGQEPRIHWHVMGGYSEPLGKTSDYLQGGYSFGAGFSVSPSANAPVNFRFDFSYGEHNASNRLIDLGQQTTPIQIDGGTGQFWSGTANVAYRVPLAYGVRGYGIAGIGAYHTRVEFTQALPYYGGYYCDPFYGFCYGGYGNTVVSSNSSTKFGWNAGVGVEFLLPYGNSWFIETRYHRISTSTPIEYLPIEIGYRF
jgi:opacity protein-like surface antigen